MDWICFRERIETRCALSPIELTNLHKTPQIITRSYLYFCTFVSQLQYCTLLDQIKS